MVTRPLCQATVIHQTTPSPLVIISQSMHNQNFKYYVGTPSLLRLPYLRRLAFKCNLGPDLLSR